MAYQGGAALLLLNNTLVHACVGPYLHTKTPCCLASAAAAPQQGAPLFSEEYLAERELNRTGALPPSTGSSKKRRSVSDGKVTAADGNNGSPVRLQNTAAKVPAGLPLTQEDAVLVVSSGSNIASDSSSSNAVTPTHVAIAQGANGVAHLHHQAGQNGAVGAGIADAGAAEGGRGLTLPFQPLSLAFRNISYFVDLPQVRSGLSFWLCAICGQPLVWEVCHALQSRAPCCMPCSLKHISGSCVWLHCSRVHAGNACQAVCCCRALYIVYELTAQQLEGRPCWQGTPAAAL